MHAEEIYKTTKVFTKLQKWKAQLGLRLFIFLLLLFFLCLTVLTQSLCLVSQSSLEHCLDIGMSPEVFCLKLIVVVCNNTCAAHSINQCSENVKHLALFYVALLYWNAQEILNFSVFEYLVVDTVPYILLQFTHIT